MSHLIAQDKGLVDDLYCILLSIPLVVGQHNRAETSITQTFQYVKV